MIPWNDRAGRFSPFKMAVFVAVLLPVLWVAAEAWLHLLGARPLTEALRQIGLWMIRLLLVTLAITPLRQVLRWPQLITVRRMVGLAVLSYALLHLSLYVVDQKFDLWRVASEIALRFYLTIGMIAIVGLVVLGITSTDGAVRRLGGKVWQRLHRIVYGIAVLGALHFFMQAKSNVYEPTLMAGFLAWLLAYRVMVAWQVKVDLRSLSILAILAMLMTAALEFAWYGFATNIDPTRVFMANFHFAHGLRPAWWALIAGFGVAVAQAARQRLFPPQAGKSRAPYRVASASEGIGQ